MSIVFFPYIILGGESDLNDFFFIIEHFFYDTYISMIQTYNYFITLVLYHTKYEKLR